MKIENDFPYHFNSGACETCSGRCCRGQEGNVWISIDELEALAAAKNMSVETFSKQYARRVGKKISLKELVINGEHRCCLLDLVENRCAVYEARPKQCRTYPFWDNFRDDPQELFAECPGITLE